MKTTRFIKLTVVFGAVALSLGCGGGGKSATSGPGSKPAAAPWPEQPLTLVCEEAAGSVEDLFCRALAGAMTTELGVAVAVTNQATAVADVWSAGHDGRQWAGISEATLIGTNVTVGDWSYFLIARAPAVISVPAKSMNGKLQTLVRESKREESEITVAAGGTGSIWHSHLLGFGTAANTAFKFRSFPGEGPSRLAAVSGQVSAVLSSIGGQAADIQNGRLKPLGMVDGEAFELRGFGEIASVADFYPGVAEAPVNRFVGFAIPGDVPAEVRERIGAAFTLAIAGPALKSLANEQIWRLDGTWGEAANQKITAAVERRIADLKLIAEAK